MRRHTLIALFIVTTTLVHSAGAEHIGLFGTPDGSDCDVDLILYQPTLLYVLYFYGPQASGAEYRITGMPGTLGVDYIATLVPAPGSNLNLGNAFDGTGHNVAWPSPQPFANGGLLLATYTLFPLTPVALAPTALRVEMRSPPTNVNFACPLIVDGAFGLHCTTGGLVVVNSGPALVEPASHPDPPDGTTMVPPHGTALRWQTHVTSCVLGTACSAVYFGTDPDPPFYWSDDCFGGFPPPIATLAPLTTYYWRVETAFLREVVSSPVWTFTTSAAVAATQATWQQVKSFYR